MGASREIGGRTGRLKSWKEIAAFFGTDERTVRRWEERGLPVYRVPGGARATIYADAGELERWFSGRHDEVAAMPEAPAPKRGLWLAIAGAVLAIAGVSALLLVRGGPPDAPAAARHEPSQKAVDQLTAATYQAERATPESMRRAIELYGQA